MKTFGIIFTVACLVVVCGNGGFGYAIEGYEASNSHRSSYPDTGVEKTQFDNANKPAALVNESGEIDGINEGGAKSIIHPGHKMKRCESVTSLRKPRFSSQVKMVNNEKIESPSSNLLNKNEVELSSSMSTNNAKDEIITTEILPRNFERPEESIKIDEVPIEAEVGFSSDKVKRHDGQNKKYVCYCVEDGCMKNHPKRPSHQNSNKNSQFLQSSDLYSRLNALAVEDSEETSEENRGESSLGRLKQGKKRPANKRPKNRKCTPFIIPCSLADNPTKFNIPLDVKPTKAPSTINPYHAHNNYQSFEPVSNVPYYGSPYIVYHPVHSVDLGSPQGSMEHDRLGGVHGFYDDPYVDPALDECIRLHGADYCLSAVRDMNDHQNYYQSHVLEHGAHPMNPNFDVYNGGLTSHPQIPASFDGDHGQYHAEHGITDSSTENVDSPENLMMHPEDYRDENQDDGDYEVGSSQALPEDASALDIDEATYSPKDQEVSASDEAFEPLDRPTRPETEIDGITDSNIHRDDVDDNVDTRIGSSHRLLGEQSTESHIEDFKYPPYIQEVLPSDEVDVFKSLEGPTHLPKYMINQETTQFHDMMDDENLDREGNIEPVDDFPNYETSTETDASEALGSSMDSSDASESEVSNLHRPVIVQPGFVHHTSDVASQTPESRNLGTTISNLFQGEFQPNEQGEDHDDDDDDEVVEKGISESSSPRDDYSDEAVPTDYSDYVQDSSEEPLAASSPEVQEPNSYLHPHREGDSRSDSSDIEPSLRHQDEGIRIPAPGDSSGSTENIDDYQSEHPHDKSRESSYEFETTHQRPQEARQPERYDEHVPSSEYIRAPHESRPSTKHQHPEPVCPKSETVSATAEQHLRDLEALTGLSIEDSKLLRGTIYKAVNQLASNVRERTQASKIASRCDIVSAPEPSQIKGLGDVPVVNHLFNIPAVRTLTLSTVKTLIPQVTNVSKDSSLGKLTDNVLENAVSIVLGDDVQKYPEEPTLGIVNENAPLPTTIMGIIKSIINRPGIGPQGARLPGIQNVIVRTLENILHKAKTVVDNSIIWDSLNDALNPPQQPENSPVIPRPSVHASKPDLRPSLHGTKPLPFIPVTEHFIKNGQWREASGTVGYHGEFPEARTPVSTLGAPEDHPGTQGDADYAFLGESQEPVSGEHTTPTRYQSPGNLMMEYVKNHSAEQANLASEFTEDSTVSPTIHHLAVDDASDEPTTEENSEETDANNNQGPIRIPLLRQSHEVTTERYHKSYTKTKKYFSASRKNKGPVQQFGESDGTALGAARVFPGSAGTSDDSNPLNSTFLGKITSDSDLSSISNVADLVGTDLYYVGDGVKLPLTVTRMNDGSFALSISNKMCEHFIRENCPCCAAKLGSLREHSDSGDHGIRQSRTRKRVHSRRVRATTANEIEAATVEDAPTVTEMPASEFTEKYNLTLSLDDKNKIKSLNKKGSPKKFRSQSPNDLVTLKNGRQSGNDAEGVKVVLELSDKPEIIDDVEKNQYIQDLLSIHDVPEENRAELVINALDGLLNSSPNEEVHDKSAGNDPKGFEYQVDNPIMERIKYIKEKEMKRGKYKYQQNFDEAAKERMETAKNILHWLKELIVKSKDNSIS